jgi:DNA-binding transcriptional LysR family regulator
MSPEDASANSNTTRDGTKSVMLHVRRALAELDAVKRSGIENSSGDVGEIQLGVRLPPIGEPIVSLLADWREKHPNVMLVVSEMNDRDLAAALEERRLDVALTFRHTVWASYRERAALLGSAAGSGPRGAYPSGAANRQLGRFAQRDHPCAGMGGESDGSRVVRILSR